MSRKKRNVPLPVIEDTPDEFIAWLEAHPHETFRRSDSDSCPLACYLNRRFRCRAKVTSGEYSVMYGGQRLREHTPAWASRFVRELDRQQPDILEEDPFADVWSVTATEALQTAQWAKDVGA